MNEFDGRKINRKALGLTRSRIYEWIAKYRESGIEALRSSKARG